MEKGHKLVDYAGRCVVVPDDPATPKYTDNCVGQYEYMPDESYKGSGTCTYKFKEAGDTITAPGKKASTSRTTRTRLPVPPANIRVLAVAPHTHMRT